MNNCNNILTHYKSSDDFKRLHIYLDCPELREEFMEIERKDCQGAHKTSFNVTNKKWIFRCLALVCTGSVMILLFL